MRQETKNVYTFCELDDFVKSNVIIANYDINTDFEWYDCAVDDFKTLCSLMGVDVDTTYFSGFSSQGDGACFEGSFAWKVGGLREFREYAPKDETLQAIGTSWFKLQQKHNYELNGTVKHSGRYYHAYCTSFEVFDYSTRYCEDDILEETQEIMRDLMQWFYSSLNAEYDYLTSDAAIIETLKNNECEFYENGEGV